MWSFEPEEEDLAEWGPLATLGSLLANTQNKIWKMMVNPGADGYTKTLNHRKVMRKMQKKQQPTENQKNSKIEI